ncbi:acidic leucine-rich nuclear phosphoprotein 32 family member B-like [Macrotis lagotis]|uniref:acidic leucine-rich nuclear phosphoprotein 32 family member B-like n=1 Tax=Macrotis lagotis TaxID=92651 RepID=UPI003D68E3E5
MSELLKSDNNVHQGSQITQVAWPSEEDLFFRHEEYLLLPKKKVLVEDEWEKWQQENWEECTALGDPYQADNLNRILRRLIRVQTLWLVDNSLTDLSAIRLPRCKELNVSKNCFTSFKQLPKIPEIQHLSLAENQITTLSGLSNLQSTPLESLMLKRNPCEFHQNYRKQVFSSLPNLKILDGVPKLPEDHSLPEMSLFSKMCIIS